MRKKTFDLLCNVGELTGIFQKSSNINGMLQLVVKVIARHMHTEACAIFLLEKRSRDLVMRAAVGFNQEMVGKLRLKIGEGITGTSLKLLKPICVPKGSEDPNFKYVQGVFEEKYESFLAVPILHSAEKLGVIILEDSKPDYYTTHDIRALTTIASQLANFLENAKILMELRQEKDADNDNGTVEGGEPARFYQGKPVYEGVAIGSAVAISDTDVSALMQPDGTVYSNEIASFEQALDLSKRQLEDIQAHMDEKLSEAGSLIFGSHLLMLSDESFAGSMRTYIKEGRSPEEAVIRVVNDYIRLFIQSENTAVQEKIHDVRDLGHRILKNLAGEAQVDGDYTGQIVVAKNLLPSELVKLGAQNVEGFVIYGSGITSHASILARSLEIPTVLVSDEEFFTRKNGERLVIDAYQGSVIAEPEEEVIDKYLRLKEEMKERRESAAARQDDGIECKTADGTPVELLTNINLLSDIRSAQRKGIGGVGLYRSEYLFLVRSDYVSEEEQLQIYRTILTEMDPVYFRTMDIGGDKVLPRPEGRVEHNPFMGMRGIRYALKNRNFFTSQLRALLQAGAKKPLFIMYPLVNGGEDFLEAKTLTEEVIEELKNDGLDCNVSPKYGAMIELPSAAATAGVLAEQADFLSIGTNDLVQYMLGVDRTNENVADRYSVYHPSILQTIAYIARAAEMAGCHLSVCGDSAGDEKMLRFYLGLGIRSISVDPRMIDSVRTAIRSIKREELEKEAETLLAMKTMREIKEYRHD